MNSNSMKVTKPYGSNQDNNAAAYSGYGIAKANKYGNPTEVSNLVFSLVNYFEYRFQQEHVFKKKANRQDNLVVILKLDQAILISQQVLETIMAVHAYFNGMKKIKKIINNQNESKAKNKVPFQFLKAFRQK